MFRFKFVSVVFMQDPYASKSRKSPKPKTDEGLDEKTVEFLLDQASAALKRQDDLVESVWRTLPFMGALLGISCTILFANAEVHRFEVCSLEFASDILFLIAFGSLALSLWYLWSLAKPKDFQYPSRPQDEIYYANAFKRWLVGNGSKAKEIDQQVVLELKTSALAQLAENHGPNMNHVESRLNIRSRAIQSALLGFALAVASQITMFVIQRVEGSADVRCTVKAATKAPQSNRGQTP